MIKKHYQQPLVITIVISSKIFMTGSSSNGDTGATGEDVPWKAKEMHEYDEDSVYGF